MLFMFSQIARSVTLTAEETQTLSLLITRYETEKGGLTVWLKLVETTFTAFEGAGKGIPGVLFVPCQESIIAARTRLGFLETMLAGYHEIMRFRSE
jgi:hypothetical protein